MKLTEGQTLHFVSLYKEHECLWDITSDFYKNKDMRQHALQRICEDMQIDGITAQDVKNKIKIMRSTYYLELDKIKRSSTSGRNVYTPRIKWFDEFNSFIRNTMTKRKVQVKIENQPEDHTDEDSALAETSTPQPPKMPKLTQISSIINNMKEINNDFSIPERLEDEFDIFGKYIAAQLRKLSTGQAILGQEEIQKVITKCRLHDYYHYEQI